MGRCLCFGVICLFAVTPAELRSQDQPDEDEKELGWKEEAELALVVTSGNAATSTFGFRNTLSHTWSDAVLVIEVNALRTETTTKVSTPVGPSVEDFVIEETSETAVTAENYLVRAKYDRNLNQRLFVFGSGGWSRNEFSGVRNRFFAAGGIGNIWFDKDTARWRTDYGLSVTEEEGTVAPSDSFVGIRLSSDYEQQLSAQTTFTNLTIADENLSETSDFRLDSLSAVAINLAAHLALKVSLRLLFDNQPSLLEASLEFPRGVPLGITVPIAAEKWDRLFNVALVLSF